MVVIQLRLLYLYHQLVPKLIIHIKRFPLAVILQILLYSMIKVNHWYIENVPTSVFELFLDTPPFTLLYTYVGPLM